MSATKRVQVILIFLKNILIFINNLFLFQQWATLSRMWYLFDAQWQDPFRSAQTLALYLTGQNKPIYHPLSMLFSYITSIQ